MNIASLSASLVAAAALAGCASARCEALDVVVDAREERTRLVSEPRGVRTDERGAWYEVSETVWRAAEPGRALSVCR